jgi:Na+/H+ antiporter NhaD/arsenite permease-like protein
MFSISSIPNILITTYAEITFVEFFLNVGILSLVVFVFTLLFFIMLYRKDLVIPKESLDIMMEYNVWNFVQNRALLYKSMISLILLMTLFIIIPPEILGPDTIAWIIAIALLLISRLNPRDIISKLDFELILYLLGIFIIAGALELSGILNLFGTLISTLGGGNAYLLLLLILWLSAGLSSSIDNIPITQVLIPVVGGIQNLNSEGLRSQLFYSLAIGANWGDNLTPLGDNILVMNICEQNKRPLTFSQFFRLGFFTTIYQLLIITLYFTVIFKFILGIFIIIITLFIIIVFYVFFKISKEKFNSSIGNVLNKIRKYIVG